MSDNQFSRLVKILERMEDSIVDRVTARVAEMFESRFRDIDGRDDWTTGTMNGMQNEHLALCFTSERHEKCVTKLELAAGN